MQRRAHEEGARLTVQVMTFVQAITVLCGAFIAFSTIGALSPETEWTGLAQRLFAAVVTPNFFSQLSPSGISLALLLVASATLTPVALYFAMSRD